MTMDRRRFLRLTGLGIAGACGAPLASALSRAAETEPAPGDLAARRWALVVDSRKCLREEGCLACTRACHRAHNVPAIADPRHEVKWIWKERFEHVFPELVHAGTDPGLRARPLPVLCNHCDNPPCVRVCPTQATWRRADGLVMVDPHRCIGCRYCITACPYGARSFNWEEPRPHLATESREYPARTKGVVEKCTFCAERLALGEPPLCVGACPGRALTFGDLGDPSSEVSALLRGEPASRRKAHLGTSPQVFYFI
jgi:molybdopterin-containing oxidoreductase family iron-sulfur binding subunit